MPDSVVTAPKRKNPPRFDHHPKNRAVALKKAWVEKTKIKSKWKAQKRKEDLASQAKLEIPTYSDEEDNAPGSKDFESKAGEAEKPTTTSDEEPKKAHLHPSRAHIHPSLPVKRTKVSTPRLEAATEAEERPSKKRRTTSSEEAPKDATKPSLRDLEKEAYSKSTLHTFKSDPLKKHSGRGNSTGGRRPETGRGQPNMKLRMNAMLERIKQNNT
ncbi:hypothetical protein CPC08DRAFT_758982 [Agrocybe pediades]|nr:hypothetical protein CPC08DRAFT_758982 [Agrocybe pediades]